MPKILIIDPHRESIALLKKALTERIPNVLVRYIISGSEARSAMYIIPEEELPQVVIIEYRMMSQHGISLFGDYAVPEYWQKVQFIVWSGTLDAFIFERSTRSGATKILNKPASYQEYEDFAMELEVMCEKTFEDRIPKKLFTEHHSTRYQSNVLPACL